MANKYIDSDKLMEAMYHRAFETDGDTMWQSGCWVRYRAIEQVVKEQPTANVVELKKGKWIPRSDVPNTYTCSNCYQVIYAMNRKYLAEFHAFCGKCGADMREETDDVI